MGNPADAEDIVAETFHRLLLALRHGNRPRRHLSAYLYRIAHNLITDRYRRQPPSDFALDEALETSARFGHGQPAAVPPAPQPHA